MRTNRVGVIGLVMLLVSVAVWADAPRNPGGNPGGDPAAQSAAWLLQKSALVHADGMHNVLLRALRQLHDPNLKPLFAQLVQKNHPALKIHGILGLAELSENKQLDLALVADLKDPATEAQLVSSAIESDLLSTDEAKQLVSWPGLDDAVKIIAATKLVHDHALADRKILDEGMASKNLAVRSTAALLRIQTGDPRAISVLHELDASTTPSRDTIRLMLAETALRYKFDAAAPWLSELLKNHDTPAGLSFLALRGVILFKAPGAGDAWLARFTRASGVAERLRLAVLAVDLADRLDSRAISTLCADKDPLIAQVGTVAHALATHHDEQAAILKLVEMNNVLTSRWVLDWATDRPLTETRDVLTGLILAAQQPPNPDRYRPDRLQNAVMATQRLAEKSPDAAALLSGIVRQSPGLTQEAVLMGLIRAQVNRPDKLVESVPAKAWKTETGRAMLVLLRAKSGAPLTTAEMDELSLIVRGGAGLEDPLRVQAAWVYIRLTHQEKVTLANVLGK